MKKMIALLALLVLVLAVCGVALADNEDCTRVGHQWSEWDPLGDPNCTDSCAAVSYCMRCQKERRGTLPAPGHNWGPWEITESATCTGTGMDTRICRRCQQIEHRSTPMLGHDWGSWKTTKEPTCTATGREERFCNRCGAKEERDKAALGHKWGKWTTKVAPTCTEKGKEQHKCSRCGVTKSRDMDPLGHKWGNWTVVEESTCVKHGKETSVCSRCGLAGERELPLKDHIWGPWYVVVTAVPGVPGLEESDCQVCFTQRFRDYETDGSEAELTPALDLVAYVLNPMEKYPLGTMVKYGYQVTNIGEVPLHDVTVVFEREGLPAETVLALFNAAPYGVGTYGSDALSAFIEMSFDKSEYHAAFSAYGVTPDGKLVKATPVLFVHPIDNGFDWTPPAPEATIIKAVANSPARPEGYQLDEEIVYEITYRIECSEKNPAMSVEVDDNGIVSHVDKLTTSADQTVTVTHKVTAADVEAGKVDNVAFLNWSDSFNRYERKSNRVTVPTTSIVDTLDPVIVKDVCTIPMNGSEYTPGETVVFSVDITNPSKTETFTVTLSDPFPAQMLSDAPDPSQYISSAPAKPWTATIGPGETKGTEVVYTVGWTDAKNGSMTNIAYFTGKSDKGRTVSGVSNPVRVPCGYKENVPEPTVELTVDKTVTSTPANGLFYQKGETVTFEIVVTNTSEEVIDEAIVYDVLLGEPTKELASIEVFYGPSSYTYTYSYVIRPEDVARGYVTNYAFVDYSVGYEERQAFSNLVIVDTDGIPDELDNERGHRLRSRGAYESCYRTLDAEGEGVTEYTRHTCGVHMKVAAAAEKLIANPDPTDPTKGWAAVQQLWQTAIDEQYAQLTSWADTPDVQMIVVQEQALYYTQLHAWEKALPGDEAEVAQLVAEELRVKCEQLCYEMHNAPKPRMDTHHQTAVPASKVQAAECGSVTLEVKGADTHYARMLCGDHKQLMADALQLNACARSNLERANAWKASQRFWIIRLNQVYGQRYIDAEDIETRTLITNERVTFGKWLDARMAMLDALYPDMPDASEALCDVIIDRAVELCAR